MNYELTKICIDGISTYLEDCELTVDEIFSPDDYIAIFGGAVRDSLANKEIYDIDILCLPDSALKLSKLIIKKGFKRVDLYDQFQLEQYKQIHAISEPWTFIKKSKIIQIIKPTASYKGTIGEYIDAFYSLLSDVDISSCGVFLEKDRDLVIRLKESHPDAITHCRSHVYEVLVNNRMYGKHRTDIRCYKLSNRDWVDLKFKDVDIKIERRMKLYGLQKPEYKHESYNKSKLSPKMSDISLNINSAFL
jgi:hypothetical protein